MAKSTVQKQIPLPLIDNPSAPDWFGDEAIGFLLTNNVLRVTFATIKADHTKGGDLKNGVVTGRLVMPASGIENLHRLLSAALEKMKSSQAEDTGASTPASRVKH